MLSWLAIVRLGLVQMCLGAIVVLMTSTLNRIMVVELALPALVPGLLVGLHYAMQFTRPGWGLRSDLRGRRTPWIIGGMIVLASGAVLAAAAVALYSSSHLAGILVSVVAYAMIGLGTAITGTSVLAFLAAATAPERRAAAATIVWLMMVAGIATSAGVVGLLLDPYSPARLVTVVTCVGAVAVTVTILTLLGLERGASFAPAETATSLRDGLAEVWAERHTRRFTQFVFVAMIAFFLQDLILEPYAGLVFGFKPGQSTTLSGAQNGGGFVGMLTVGILATGYSVGSLRAWVIAGCVGSALAALGIAAIGPMGLNLMLVLTVTLGFCNGVFAVAAIGAMMALAGKGRHGREGARMGVWGAAQAIASGIGGLAGAAAADALRLVLPVDYAFASVFAMQALVFLLAAGMAYRVIDPGRDRAMPTTFAQGA